MSKSVNNYTVNIATSAIVKVVVVLLALAFLYFIRDVILIFFLSVVLAAAIDPLVTWAQARRIPRSIGVLLVYILFFAMFSVIGVLAVDPLKEQTRELAGQLPSLYAKAMTRLFPTVADPTASVGIASDVNEFSNYIRGLAGDGIPTITNFLWSGVSGGIQVVSSALFVLVLTFYLVVQDRGMKRFLQTVAPSRYQPYLSQLSNKIHEKMGLWMRGQLFLSAVIFLISAVGLYVLGVKYWLVLALIAGVLEVVPLLGPILAAVIAVLLTLGVSPLQSLAVLILYAIIQQLENHIMVPKIMEKAVGLNPIIVILALVVGFKLAGVVGGLVAVPVATMINVFLRDVLERKVD